MKRWGWMTVGTVLALAGLVSMAAVAGGLIKATSANAEAQKLIDQAWALERTDSTADIYKQCVALIEQADKLDPNNPEIIIELSRYTWNYGDNLPKDTDEQKKTLEGLYGQGLDYAEKSLKIKETVGAHYWLAVNKSASLEFSNILSQAAAFPSIYSHSQYVTNNEPNYYYGAAGRLWAEILSRVPKKVVELVNWDVNEAVAEIDKAIVAEPRYFDNYLYKARFFHVYFGNDEEALKLLDEMLKKDPNVFPEEINANKVSQRDGKDLWRKITGKEYPELPISPKAP